MRLQPGEWVLAAFLLYAFARLIAAGDFTLNQRSIPRADFAIVLMAVMCVRLLLDYRRAPWPETLRVQRRLHLVFLVLFLGLSPAILPTLPDLGPLGGWHGNAEDLFIAMYGWAEVVLLVLLPFTLFWLATAQHIKVSGHLDTLGLVQSRWRPAVHTLRPWVPLVALLYFYGLMGPVIGRGVFGDQDAALARIDRALFLGHDPRLLCEGIISTRLSEWMSACYVFYIPLFPIVFAAVFARHDAARFRELAFALTLVFAVGYVGYTIVPAQGPLFVDHFDVSLDAYLGSRLKAQLMDRTRVPRDCFPSLHTAASLTLLWGAFRNVRWLFWLLTPVVLTIPVACVYLRYHYVIDVIAGAVLSAGVVTLTVRSTRLQAAFHA